MVSESGGGTISDNPSVPSGTVLGFVWLIQLLVIISIVAINNHERNFLEYRLFLNTILILFENCIVSLDNDIEFKYVFLN